jgi:hypothetical protein
VLCRWLGVDTNEQPMEQVSDPEYHWSLSFEKNLGYIPFFVRLVANCEMLDCCFGF